MHGLTAVGPEGGPDEIWYWPLNRTICACPGKFNGLMKRNYGPGPNGGASWRDLGFAMLQDDGTEWIVSGRIDNPETVELFVYESMEATEADGWTKDNS